MTRTVCSTIVQYQMSPAPGRGTTNLRPTEQTITSREGLDLDLDIHCVDTIRGEVSHQDGGEREREMLFVIQITF